MNIFQKVVLLHKAVERVQSVLQQCKGVIDFFAFLKTLNCD